MSDHMTTSYWPADVRFADDAEAIADHGTPCIGKYGGKRGGRPRLPIEVLIARVASKLPNGRPKHTGTPGEQTRNQCDRLVLGAMVRWQRETGIPATPVTSQPSPQLGSVDRNVSGPATFASDQDCFVRYKAEPPAAWTRLSWRERKAAIWSRARAST